MDAQEVQKKCFEQLLRSYDPEMGGFSKAPKFPQPVNFNFLFHYYSLKPQEDRAKQGLKMVLHTLDMMAKGGIHDHISQVSYNVKIQNSNFWRQIFEITIHRKRRLYIHTVVYF